MTNPDTLPVGHRSLTCEGTRLYVDPADQRGAALLERGGPLHPEALAMWRSLVRQHPWDWVLDVGANYGEMTVAVQQLTDGRIVALEPDPHTARFLRATLDGFPNCAVLQEALGATSGTTSFYRNREWSGNSTLVQPAQIGDDWDVFSTPVTTPQQLFERLAIGPSDRVLVKLDIEGAEAEVLQALLPQLRSVSAAAVMVERIRLSPEDIGWMETHYEPDYWHPDTASFTARGCSWADVSAGSGIYIRDVVARPRLMTARAG